MKYFLQRHRTSIGIGGAVAALGVAIIYAIYDPTPAITSSALANAILRYGHSFCWLLLASASALWALKRYPKVVSILLTSALIVYVLFMVLLLLS
jgi:hypothetical protein